LKRQGFRVVTIAQQGLERTQFDNELKTKFSVAERVSTNIEMMDAILRNEGKTSSYHVIGHSYGASCGLLLALNMNVTPESSAFLYPAENSSSFVNHDWSSTHLHERKVLSLTLLSWSKDFDKDSFLEYAKNRKKINSYFGSNNDGVRLYHLEAALNAGEIFQNISSMLSRVKVPILIMNAKEDETFLPERIQETASLFENLSVIIENYNPIKLEDIVQPYDFQHTKFFSPLVAPKAISKISKWIESQIICASELQKKKN